MAAVPANYYTLLSENRVRAGFGAAKGKERDGADRGEREERAHYIADFETLRASDLSFWSFKETLICRRQEYVLSTLLFC